MSDNPTQHAEYVADDDGDEDAFTCPRCKLDYQFCECECEDDDDERDFLQRLYEHPIPPPDYIDEARRGGEGA